MALTPTAPSTQYIASGDTLPVGKGAPTTTELLARADGTVRVTWTAASSGADRYIVRPLGGGGTTADASAREVTISGLAAGSSHRFEVETQLGDTTAVSAASNQVTVANVPGTVSGLSAGVIDRNATTVRVDVSFNAASANGSPVTGYVVAYSGGGVSGSTTISGTSTTLTISCSGQALCTSGGTLNVSVHPTSAVGNGAAVSTTAPVSTPPPPPPANGDVKVTGVGYEAPDLYQSEIPVYATFAHLPSWSAFSGTCHVYVSGAINTNFQIDCGTGGEVYLGGAMGPAQVQVSVQTSSGVTSATASGEIPHRTTWGWCRHEGGMEVCSRSRTRCKYVRVSSASASMPLTVRERMLLSMALCRGVVRRIPKLSGAGNSARAVR